MQVHHGCAVSGARARHVCSHEGSGGSPGGHPGGGGGRPRVRRQAGQQRGALGTTCRARWQILGDSGKPSHQSARSRGVWRCRWVPNGWRTGACTMRETWTPWP